MKPKTFFNKLNTAAFLILVAGAVTAISFVSSCTKQFDQPPYDSGDPDLTVNTTIAEIKALYDEAGSSVTISDSLIFSAIVISSDEAGNIYKQLFVEDTTGGINIQIDNSSLYADYPLGMRVFVKMAGLSVSKYYGLYEIGLGLDDDGDVQRISSGVMTDYVVSGSTGHAVDPVTLTISELSSDYQSMLVTIEDVQFADTTATYADPTETSSSVNLTLQACDGNTVTLRSSSYADFAGTTVVAGKGPITAIASVYNSTSQLIIRSLDDVAAMTDPRCGTSTDDISTIKELRDAYTGSDVSLTSGTVTGVVISNPDNESSGSVRVVAEDNSAGILVYVPGSTTTYSVGDEVSVNLSGASLTTYNGEIELVEPTITVTGSSGSVTPLSTTLAAILEAGSSWSTRLVVVSGLTISTSSTGSSSTTYSFSDGTNSVTSYVRSSSGITLSDGTATVTGYISIYKSSSATDTTYQITIRTADDVVYSNSDGDSSSSTITLSSSPLTYTFDGIADGLPTGISVRYGMSSSAEGTEGSFTSSATVWTKTSFGFYNYASGSSLSSDASESDQSASTDRALGVRQTSSYDSGAGFVFELGNTANVSNLTMSFDLQSLDASSPRTMEWEISYATGSEPTSFTTLDSSDITGTMTTGGSSFTSNSINVDLSDLSGISSAVYIRIVAAGSSGSGNRPTSAINNLKFTWE